MQGERRQRKAKTIGARAPTKHRGREREGKQSSTIVGKSYPRLEGPDKVTGRARYSCDMRLPGQLFARVLRSPLPHARIARIETSRAEQLPGVRAVLSSANCGDIDWYENGKLFDSTVRFVGDEVAAVAADNEHIAEDALRLIDVDYEPRPFVIDAAAALQPDAPTVHEAGNLAGEPSLDERGNVAAGLQRADVVIDQTYVTETALHNSLEAHGCTVSWTGDRLIVYASTQGIFAVRHELAKRLRVAEDRIRVITQHMGGGFGSKQGPWKHDAIASLLARRAGRPVQLVLDREAENLAVGNRNATRQRVRLGAKRDGTLTAIDAEVLIQAGAYLVGGEASDVQGIYQTLYRCANVRTRQTAVFTHTGPAVAFRAPGYVEGAFALESAMDELARALSIDPIDLRLRNYTEREQSRGKRYTSPSSLASCYERVTEAFGWRVDAKPLARGSKRRGVGFAAHVWAGGGGHPPGDALVTLGPKGTAEVVTGTQDIGTGTRTALAQVAAEELGVPLDRVSLALGDTELGPYAPSSAGSATLATLAPAVKAAAADAKQQLLEAAAPLLNDAAAHLFVRDGYVRSEVDRDRAMTVGALCDAIATRLIIGKGERKPNPEHKSVRTFGAQCVEVEVDIETGEIRVLRVAASHDCGRMVNPAIVESQVIGGVTQGLGFALTEERVVDAASGVVLNANLEEYKIPTLADIPAIDSVALDVPDLEANTVGAKGIGEPPIIPTAPAIANAVFDAVGIRMRHAPLTRQRVLEALHAQRRQVDEGKGQ